MKPHRATMSILQNCNRTDYSLADMESTCRHYLLPSIHTKTITENHIGMTTMSNPAYLLSFGVKSNRREHTWESRVSETLPILVRS